MHKPTMKEAPKTPEPDEKQRRTEDIAKYKGESHSYSLKRPIRKVLSRYAR